MNSIKQNALIWLAIALKLLIHLFCITQYGYFRDELYYIASTSHLSFGYVDHPPLSILLLAIHTTIFGTSFVAIRLLSIAAGLAVVPLTAAIAREFNGGKYAQAFSAFAVVLAPAYLGTHHIYSMNAWDHLFWTLAAYVFVRILSGNTKLWWQLGFVLGFGLLNKISMLWLGFGFFTGLLVTSHRRMLKTPGPWIAFGIAVLLFSPYIIWNWANGFPTLEFIRNASELKMVHTNPMEFIGNQILEMSPPLFPLWFMGLLWLWRSKQWRILAITYLTVFGILVLSPTAKSSYLVPAYPMLFAAGSIAFERFFSTRPWLKLSTAGVMLLLSVPLIPFAVPILSVDRYLAYAHRLGIVPSSGERNPLGELPQHYADMFGWGEMAGKAAAVFRSLTPEEQKHCVIYGQNYGEAGAIDVLGGKLGLPRASSGHNSYWLWGPSDPHPLVVIILNGNVQDDSEFFESVQAGAVVECKHCMPYERNAVITIGRKPKIELDQLWPRLKHFI